MDCSRHVKIADFGTSKLLRVSLQSWSCCLDDCDACGLFTQQLIYLSSRTHKLSNNTQKSVAGTAYWMAPEVIRGETVNQKADIWWVPVIL